MLVDSHCHLDFPDFREELPAVVERALGAGVRAMLTIGTHVSRFEQVRAVAETFDPVWCTVGIHPHEAGREPEVGPQRLARLAEHPKVVGFGETGLDYHYDHSPREAQQRSFRAHLVAARLTGLPVVVHSREAEADTMGIVEDEMAKGPISGLIHCFSGSRAMAERAVALGFYVSFSGILTFNKADDLRATAKALPLDRLLVETDAPYLAPVPNRGKRNEPAFVVHTLRKLAEVRGISTADAEKATTDAFFRLFAKARRP
jgi:TatD DNase family protein